MIDAWNAVPEMAVALLGNLVHASIIGGLLALAAWLLCRLHRRLSPAARAWIWWLVSLKFLLLLLAVPVIQLPVLPLVHDLAGQQVTRAISSVTAPDIVSRGDTDMAEPASAPWLSARGASTGALALVLLWVTGLGLGLLATGQQFIDARGVRRRARAVHDQRVLDLFDRLREQLGVCHAELRVHPGIGSPRVTGLWKPLVLLPEHALRTLIVEELEWVLSHELFHLRRKDLWLGLVPATVEWLFFFHPLARLTGREYGASRELACDSGVLGRVGSTVGGYSRLLVKLGATAHTASAATALVERRSLKRRLEMLYQLTRLPRARASWPFILIAVLALVPLRLVASDRGSGSAPAPATVPAAQAKPASASHASDPASAAAPASQTAPASPAPAAPRPDIAPAESGDVQMSGSQDSDLRFVLLRDDQTVSNVVWVDGSSKDVEAARALRHGAEGLLYVRMKDRKWVVRDPEILRRVDSAFDPQREIGRQQAELGRQQAELGRQQAALGGSQAELGRRQAELGQQQARLAIQETELAARQMTLNAALARTSLDGVSESREEAGSAEERDVAELRKSLHEVSAQQRELAAQQRELGKRQRALGEQQRALSDKQNPLAERQRPLATQQRGLATRQREAGIRARLRVREIVERAIAEGKAEVVRP